MDSETIGLIAFGIGILTTVIIIVLGIYGVRSVAQIRDTLRRFGEDLRRPPGSDEPANRD